MNQTVSPRKRMAELLAIPDSQRTDAEWDELNELEISLAPGNRIGGKDPVGAVSHPGGQQRNRGRNKRPPMQGNGNVAPGFVPSNGGGGASAGPAAAGGDGGAGKRPFKKFRKRPGKGPGGAGGDGGNAGGGGESGNA